MTMDFLINTKQKKAARVLVYGQGGCGKSTLAANCDAIIMDIEGGLSEIEAKATPRLTSIEDVKQYYALILDAAEPGMIVAIDTVDWLERLFKRAIGEVNGVESSDHIGYGKGPGMVAAQWSRFVGALEAFRDKGVSVLMLGHSEVKTYNPPEGDGYDRHQPKLDKLSLAVIVEWCDAVCFWSQTSAVKKDGLKNRAIGELKSVIHMKEKPTHVAKCRFSAWPETASPEEMAQLIKEASHV